MHEEYKNFVDSLAARALKKPTLIQMKRLEELGLANNREAIDLLLDTYRSALHDVAAYLEELTSLGDAVLTINGEKIEGSPFASINFDLTCRLEGDPWPDED